MRVRGFGCYLIVYETWMVGRLYFCLGIGVNARDFADCFYGLQGRRSIMAVDKMLVAFDESEGSKKALKTASELAAANPNAHIDLV